METRASVDPCRDTCRGLRGARAHVRPRQAALRGLGTDPGCEKRLSGRGRGVVACPLGLLGTCALGPGSQRSLPPRTSGVRSPVPVAPIL